MMWYLVRFDEDCKAIMMDMVFSSYDMACDMQETMEVENPDYSFLIYTADEWIYEIDNGLIA